MTTAAPTQIRMTKAQFNFYYNLINPSLDRFTDEKFITAYTTEDKQVISIKVNVTVWKNSTPISGVFTRNYNTKGLGPVARILTGSPNDQ